MDVASQEDLRTKISQEVFRVDTWPSEQRYRHLRANQTLSVAFLPDGIIVHTLFTSKNWAVDYAADPIR